MNPENPTVVAGEYTVQQMRLDEEANVVKSTEKPYSHRQSSWQNNEAFGAQSTSLWGSLPLTPVYNLSEPLQVPLQCSLLNISSPANDFCLENCNMGSRIWWEIQIGMERLLQAMSAFHSWERKTLEVRVYLSPPVSVLLILSAWEWREAEPETPGLGIRYRVVSEETAETKEEVKAECSTIWGRCRGGFIFRVMYSIVAALYECPPTVYAAW